MPSEFRMLVLESLGAWASTDRLLVASYAEFTRAGALLVSEGALSGGVQERITRRVLRSWGVAHTSRRPIRVYTHKPLRFFMHVFLLARFPTTWSSQSVPVLFRSDLRSCRIGCLGNSDIEQARYSGISWSAISPYGNLALTYRKRGGPVQCGRVVCWQIVACPVCARQAYVGLSHGADRFRHIEGETGIDIDIHQTSLPYYRYGTIEKSTRAEMVYASFAPQGGLAPSTEQQSFLRILQPRRPKQEHQDI
ncbi:hypothetical protein KCU95_g36, partial [Aureobasidium melanogenum]